MAAPWTNAAATARIAQQRRTVTFGANAVSFCFIEIPIRSICGCPVCRLLY
jgi:hypothetical protein